MPSNAPELLALLKQCSELRGLSGGFVFSMDAVHIPDKTLMHFVRLETIAFDSDGEPPHKLDSVMDAELDPRLSILANCFIPTEAKQIVEVLTMLATNHSLLMDLLKSFPSLPLPARLAIENVLRLNQQCMEEHSK